MLFDTVGDWDGISRLFLFDTAGDCVTAMIEAESMLRCVARATPIDNDCTQARLHVLPLCRWVCFRLTRRGLPIQACGSSARYRNADGICTIAAHCWAAMCPLRKELQ